ncbi:MAG: glycosyltransferase family 2 protein [Candidatus Omnitrophica bacterium]|nr:glycosyltransferase family 2 protein [Candidatus Omnitrophota bacterium]
MLVSVIIPTYNRKELVRRAIQSVLNQTFKKYALIVVDDGSTDQTDKILKEFKGAKIHFYRQDRKGVSAARNRGIRESRGELIAFLDSDDVWHPKKLEVQVDFFRKNPTAMIAQTEEEWIRDGRPANPMKKHKKYSGDIFRASLPLCIVSPSAVMMRRELFDKVGYFDDRLSACEDYDMWLRVAARYPIYLIEGRLTIKYGGHADQLSRTVPSLDKYRIQSMLKLLDSKILTPEQRKWTIEELKYKAKIYGEGCIKHGREEEGKKILESVLSL